MRISMKMGKRVKAMEGRARIAQSGSKAEKQALTEINKDRGTPATNGIGFHPANSWYGVSLGYSQTTSMRGGI